MSRIYREVELISGKGRLVFGYSHQWKEQLEEDVRALSLELCHPLAMGTMGGYRTESRDMKVTSCSVLFTTRC